MFVVLVFIESTIFLINASFAEMRITTQDGQTFKVPVNSKDIKVIEFVETQASSRINPVGTWRRGQEGSTWTFTVGADGRYFAQENGFAQVNGPAYFTPSGSFRIDYRSRDGVYTGYTEMSFAPDGRMATGSWNSYTPDRGSSKVNWTRVD